MAREGIVRLAARRAWEHLGRFLGGRRRRRVEDIAGLRGFLSSRASMVSQASLYGYLRTRAGTRFPELFSHDEFSKSINIAKWNIWLACLSDLAVYAGVLLTQRAGIEHAEVRRILTSAVDTILAEIGVPGEAGTEFAGLAQGVHARVAACNPRSLGDDETAFSESPAALVRWAPVLEDLKRLDEEIVRNSVRFRWQEVRRELRADLDAPALVRSIRGVGGADAASAS